MFQLSPAAACTLCSNNANDKDPKSGENFSQIKNADPNCLGWGIIYLKGVANPTKDFKDLFEKFAVF